MQEIFKQSHGQPSYSLSLLEFDQFIFFSARSGQDHYPKIKSNDNK